MITYTVRARRWEHGWELHVDGVGVTQSHTLADAERMARDYIATVCDLDEYTGEVSMVPELGGLENEAHRAAERTEQAARAQQEAARQSRAVARKLRGSGLSVTDTATIMGVSRGRVSQLTRA